MLEREEHTGAGELNAEISWTLDDVSHLLENMTDGFLALDREWRVAYVNGEAERLNGMRRQEMMGRNHWELFPATVGTTVHRELLRAAGEHVAVDFENYYEPWKRWFHVKAYPAASGGIAVFFEDITARKAAEEERAVLLEREHEALARAEQEVERRREMERELRYSEERFRGVFESSAIGVAVLTMEGRFQRANQAFCAMTGYSEQDLKAMTCSQLTHLEDRERTNLLVEQLLAGEIPTFVLENRYVTADRQTIWVQHSISAMCDANGQPEHLLALCEDVTERKHAERAMLHLSAIIDSSDDAIVSKDLNGIVASWNKGAERLFGYTAEEAVGKSITIIIPPERLSEEADILGRVKRGERVDHFETIRRRKDGSLLNISLTISPVKDKTGKIIGASKIARDITEYRRAQEAIGVLNAQLTSELAAMTRMQQLSTRLVQADEFSVLLDEIVDAGIEITRADMGNIQLFEAGFLKIVAQRGLGPQFIEYFNVEHGAGACGTAVARGERVIVEDVTSSPIYRGRPELEAMLGAGVRAVQSTPLISRSGELLGVFSTHYRTPQKPDHRALRMLDLLARQAADLIERKRAEAELRASERRFRQLADSMPQIVWTARQDGYVDYLNERWYEYTGFERGIFGDASWHPILHPDDLKRSYESWYHSVSTGEPYEIEYRFWDRREKRWRWFIGRALPVQDENGNIVKWFGSCTDIDEQKRVEDELRHANQDLEQFAYSASHDLQEPLRGIKIYSELLTRRYSSKLDGQALEFLDYLRGNASRMELLVRDLLAYTHVTKFVPPSESTDANEALKGTLASLEGAIMENGACVTFDPLPSIRIHHAHLQQLFQNLVGNAIKYRSPERAPTVHVSAERREGQWLFSVADNGIGIEPEYKERIFGLFKRLHSGDQYAGTGIGLAICQRIVDRYQGRIWVESTPGKGSTFKFTLPG